MHVNELELPKRVTDLLVEAGIETVEAVRAAGRDGLIAVNGIGPGYADDVLAAVASLPEPESDPESTPEPEPESDPAAVIRVRNDNRVAVLLGHRWLYPGETRMIRRFQMVAGLVEV